MSYQRKYKTNSRKQTVIPLIKENQMEERIQDRLQRISGILRYFGNLADSDMLTRISVYLKWNEIETEEQIKNIIYECEAGEEMAV